MNAASLSNVSRSFSIDARLDLERVAEILRLKGSVHFSSILKLPDAKALYDEMEGCREWALSLKAEGWDRQLRQEAGSLNAAQEMEVRDRAYAAAATQHSHLYKRGFISLRNAPILFSFTTFLNSTPFIEFAQQVTGYRPIDIHVRALCLGPGHFISGHSDEPDPGVCRTNFLFQLTPDWSPDWGGQLELLNSDGGSVQEAYIPRFNSLSMFSAPRWHAVSMVALFAPKNRYTISGFIDGS